MNLKDPVNKNYCASVIKIQNLVPLAKCDNIQGAIIFGNQVIVSKDTKIGDIGIFFPIETQLSPDFLKYNNLYDHPELNLDTTKKGWFNIKGRIKCVKFRGHKSEGFFVPLSFLNYLLDFGSFELNDFPLGCEFDEIDGQLICQKYIIGKTHIKTETKKIGRKAKPQDRIVDGQFHFHIDTANLRKNVWQLNSDDYISITYKYHGTSGIISNILVNRNLNWIERLLQNWGVKISDQEYQIVHSSRRVIKGVGELEKDGEHFYGSNIWRIVTKEISDRVPKGYTVYFEIVGYTPDGKEIQKDYTYSCQYGTHRVLIYRVTFTNLDGKVFELDLNQRLYFCQKYGFDHVDLLYQGYVDDFCLAYNKDWREDFMTDLYKSHVDKECIYNPGKPREGVVVRVENRFDECKSFKLKGFDFLRRESELLDKMEKTGEVDIETQESEEVV